MEQFLQIDFFCSRRMRVTLILPPDPPDPPAGRGRDQFRRCLQGILEPGGGWRVWDANRGMCQTRQPVPAQMRAEDDYAVGKAAVRSKGARTQR